MMGDGEQTVKVSFAQGWDLASRTVVHPLSRSEAEARDRAGQPYVMVHRLEGRTSPVEVHLVAWGDSHVGAWVYDDQGRRTMEVDWRLLEPGRLFLRHVGQWRYDTDGQAEFAPEAGRSYVDLFPDGKGSRVSRPKGDSGPSHHTPANIPEEERWHAREAFGVRGAGQLLLSQPLPSGQQPEFADATGSGTDAWGAHRAADGRPSLWRPPRPARRAHLDELFEPGTRIATSVEPEMTVSAILDIATLRLPSGRLVVADPLTEGRGAGRVLSERIPPGEYRVQAAVVAFESEYEDVRTAVKEEVAVRLLLAEEPAASWEPALAEGDDVRLLRENEIYGFDTDGAAGAFADASGWEGLADRYRRYLVEQEDDAGETVSDGYVRTTDQATGGDLVSFCTDGDGTHPVWLGRASTGKPVSVVVVVGRLPGLRLL
ncbi:DUF4241 domain-containing protein [Streptomyces sp. NPDC051287]|uniref:DUF4241 domain-containing protein n=1 Tax=Streptomyces sp. NPDC051287 TaxID=3365648 RepID=UPI0037A06074